MGIGCLRLPGAVRFRRFEEWIAGSLKSGQQDEMNRQRSDVNIMRFRNGCFGLPIRSFFVVLAHSGMPVSVERCRSFWNYGTSFSWLTSPATVRPGKVGNISHTFKSRPDDKQEKIFRAASSHGRRRSTGRSDRRSVFPRDTKASSR